MRIGPLRHRLIIQNYTATQNSYGEEIPSWSDFATIWGQVTPTSAQEQEIATGAQRQTTITHRVRIRYRDDVTPKMRIKWGSRTLNIESAEDPSAKQELLLLRCSEVQKGAATS